MGDPINELLIFLQERGDGYSVDSPTRDRAVAMEKALRKILGEHARLAVDARQRERLDT